MYSTPKIMLIDDNEVDSYLTMNTLVNNEFSNDITVKYSGIEALEYLKKHQTTPQHWPDIIFVNLYMPNIGADEFLREFEKFPIGLTKTCSVFILLDKPTTSSPFRVNKNFSGFIEKPILGIDLEKVTNQVLSHEIKLKNVA